jgi:hypothetical protein
MRYMTRLFPPSCHDWLPSAIVVSLLMGAGICPAAPAVPQSFDGTWNVVVACLNAADGARGYTWQFTVEVRNGALAGNYSTAGSVPSGTLTGQIHPDGSALLNMHGLTGIATGNNPRNRSTAGVSAGTPFHYTMTAQFAGNSGTGKRTEGRECTAGFNKV